MMIMVSPVLIFAMVETERQTACRSVGTTTEACRLQAICKGNVKQLYTVRHCLQSIAYTYSYTMYSMYSICMYSMYNIHSAEAKNRQCIWELCSSVGPALPFVVRPREHPDLCLKKRWFQCSVQAVDSDAPLVGAVGITILLSMYKAVLFCGQCWYQLQCRGLVG